MSLFGGGVKRLRYETDYDNRKLFYMYGVDGTYEQEGTNIHE